MTISSNHELKEKNKSFTLLAFIFTIMFSVEIAGVDMRYLTILFWLIYSLTRSKKIKLKFSFSLIIFPLLLYLIIMYSLILVGVNNTENSFEILRSARAISTYVVILLFFSSGNYSHKQIINSLMYVLLLHAISIIAGIIFPSFKEIILPISQYSKEFMRVRSSGLISGYDDAGYLCNIGLSLILIKNTVQKNKLVDKYALIFIIGAIFTSRVNIAVMALVLGVMFIVNIKQMNIKGLINISKYLVIIGMFAIIILSLTTNIGYELRTTLLHYYPGLYRITNLMDSSYTDYGIHSGVISRHMSLSDLSLMQIVIGAGIRKTTSDVGYVKTIYSIGIIGIIFQILVYLRAIININRISKRYKYDVSLQISSLTFILGVILMFIMEFKISFIFSSTTYEMLSILYISVLLTEKNNKSLIV